MSIDTPAWVRDAVFYQVFPDRLASSRGSRSPDRWSRGTRRRRATASRAATCWGSSEHLDRLATLGVTALYLNPVFTSASNHRYHTDDYFHVDPLLGGDAALRELLDEAMRAACGSSSTASSTTRAVASGPFHHVVENGSGSPYRRLVPPRCRGALGAGPSGRSLPRDRGADSRTMRYVAAAMDGLPAGSRPTLPRLPGLVGPAGAAQAEPRRAARRRAYLLDVAEHWIRFGIDGWRLDVAEEVGERLLARVPARVSAPSTRGVPRRRDLARPARVAAGDTFDGLMNYPLAEALVGFVGGARIDWDIVDAQVSTARPIAASMARRSPRSSRTCSMSTTRRSRRSS